MHTQLISPAPTLHVFEVDRKRLEAAKFEVSSDSPTIVLLHEALGSVRHWKSFPALLARATECNTLVYSRPGHGDSDGPVEERGLAYYERQAQVALPALLQAFDIQRPILFGHSEGAAIAMAFASAFPSVARALILECPLVHIEPTTLTGLQRAEVAYQTTDLEQRLRRYHRDPEPVFRAFLGPWRSNRGSAADYFRTRVPLISCPTLAIWGDRDEYSSPIQAQLFAEYLPDADLITISDCGHTPHRDKVQGVLKCVVQFLNAVWICSSEFA